MHVGALRSLARLGALLALLGSAPLRAGADVSKDPEWYRGAVVYGVIPPRFGREPLKAVTARLDALRDLGVDALWLAPIHPTDDPGDVSYAITDYFGVRADFGTPEDLRTLVREAHARGIRVLLDFVPNHTSAGHPHHRDAEARGRDSRYWGWYDRDPGGTATHYFDWKHLPNLDYENPLVREMMKEAFAYWVREYDVDGFRVDAAWGIRERAPAFWGELRRHLAQVKPGLFLLAEASARDPFYVRNGFDAAYDWTGELGRWAWEKVFDDPARVGPALDAALSSSATPMHRVARFLNNNDTGERFVTRHGVATTRVAAVLMHALPGIAIVYTGDEVGAEFLPYEEGPPLTWVDGHGLRPLYRRLAALREELPALRRGAFRRVPVPGHPAAYAFLRDAGPEGRALVVLNFGAAARLRLEGVAGRSPPTWDALAEREVAVRRARSGTLELEMSEKDALVLVDRPVASRAAPGAAAAASAAPVADEAVWRLLARGGHVILLRHAATEPGLGDPPGFRLGDCETQRNLSAAGREEARRLGEAFRARGIPVARVLSSRWCRCLDTARLAFGRVEEWPALDSFFDDPGREPAQTSAVRRRIAEPPAEENLVLVTHQVNITALTGISPSPGELVVATPRRDGAWSVAARLRPGAR